MSILDELASHDLCPTRRTVLLATLFAALPIAMSRTAALGSMIDPSET